MMVTNNKVCYTNNIRGQIPTILVQIYLELIYYCRKTLQMKLFILV